MTMRLAVLISGRGSNLAALLDAQPDSNFQVAHVISNNAQAKGLDIAQDHGVNNSHVLWKNRALGEQHALELLAGIQPDLIVLAGFMKVLSADFVSQYENKIINIHPSLLPLYPGLNTHQRAIDDGQSTHGASVHVVDDQLDHGQVLSQTHVSIDPNDSAETLAQKLIAKEHRLLTKTVQMIASGQLSCDNGWYFKGEPLNKPWVEQA